MLKTKRMRVNFLYTLALIITFFFVSPKEKVYAYFSDDASEAIGLKLTLGDMDLEATNVKSQIKTIEQAKVATLISEINLENIGSLYGKLGYKVEVKEKVTGVVLPKENYQVQFNIGDQKMEPLVNNSQFHLLDEQFFQPGKEKTVVVRLSVKELPEQDTDLEVKITFLMVQTNSELKEMNFFDKEVIQNEVTITKEEAPPHTEEWPSKDDTRWQELGPLRYLVSEFNPAYKTYFGDEISEKVGTINNRKIYIENSEGVPYTFNYSLSGYETRKLEYADGKEIYEFILKTDSAKNLLAYVENQTISLKVPGYDSYKEIFGGDIASKRIVLNSDFSKLQDNQYAFKERTVQLVSNKKQISLSEVSYNGQGSYREDANWGSYVKILDSFNVKVHFENTTDNFNMFSASVYNNEITIKINNDLSYENGKTYSATMVIELSKDNGEKIYIKRNVEHTIKPPAPEGWPSKDDTRWQELGPLRYLVSEFNPAYKTYFGDGISEKIGTINNRKIYIENSEGVPYTFNYSLSGYETTKLEYADGKEIYEFTLKTDSTKGLLAYIEYQTISLKVPGYDSYKEIFGGNIASKRIVLNSDFITENNTSKYVENSNIVIENQKKIELSEIAIEDHNYPLDGNYGKIEKIPVSLSIDVHFEKNPNLFIASVENNVITIKLNEEFVYQPNVEHTAQMIIKISKGTSEKIYLKRNVEYTAPSASRSKMIEIPPSTEAKKVEKNRVATDIPKNDKPEEVKPEVKGEEEADASLVEPELPIQTELPAEPESQIIEEPISVPETLPEEVPPEIEAIEPLQDETTIEEIITIEEKVPEPEIPLTE